MAEVNTPKYRQFNSGFCKFVKNENGCSMLIPQKVAKPKNVETKDVYLDTQIHADMEKNVNIKVNAYNNI